MCKSPGQVAQLAGASSHTPKGCGFNSQSRHILRFGFNPPTGYKATDQCFSLIWIFLFLSL